MTPPVIDRSLSESNLVVEQLPPNLKNLVSIQAAKMEEIDNGLFLNRDNLRLKLNVSQFITELTECGGPRCAGLFSPRSDEAILNRQAIELIISLWGYPMSKALKHSKATSQKEAAEAAEKGLAQLSTKTGLTHDQKRQLYLYQSNKSEATVTVEALKVNNLHDATEENFRLLSDECYHVASLLMPNDPLPSSRLIRQGVPIGYHLGIRSGGGGRGDRSAHGGQAAYDLSSLLAEGALTDLYKEIGMELSLVEEGPSRSKGWWQGTNSFYKELMVRAKMKQHFDAPKRIQIYSLMFPYRLPCPPPAVHGRSGSVFENYNSLFCPDSNFTTRLGALTNSVNIKDYIKLYLIKLYLAMGCLFARIASCKYHGAGSARDDERIPHQYPIFLLVKCIIKNIQVLQKEVKSCSTDNEARLAAKDKVRIKLIEAFSDDKLGSTLLTFWMGFRDPFATIKKANLLREFAKSNYWLPPVPGRRALPLQAPQLTRSLTSGDNPQINRDVTTFPTNDDAFSNYFAAQLLHKQYEAELGPRPPPFRRAKRWDKKIETTRSTLETTRSTLEVFLKGKTLPSFADTQLITEKATLDYTTRELEKKLEKIKKQLVKLGKNPLLYDPDGENLKLLIKNQKLLAGQIKTKTAARGRLRK